MSSYLDLVRTMNHFDLRYAIPLFINFLKSQSRALSWDQTTWTILCFTIFMLLLFSVLSINIPLTPPWPFTTTLIRFQFGNFAPHLTVLLVASLVFPRALFFYAYPAILIFASCFSSVLFLLRRSLDWVNKKLTALPVWNLYINSTLAHHHEQEADIDIESQAHQIQVSVDNISPQDSDSDAETNDETLVL